MATGFLRIAVLPVENLTGDASFDWVSSAAPAMLVEQTRSATGPVFLPVTAVRDAYANSASRMVHGYFTRSSSVDTARGAPFRFTFEVEDAASHKMLETIPVQGGVLAAMDLAAHALSPSSHPFPSQNAEAIAAWGAGNFERAIELDSDFGAAWAARIRQLSFSGKSVEAEEAAVRALSRGSLRSAYQRAEIAAMLADLRKDYRARAQALESMAALIPTDVSVLRSAAEAETQARSFEPAAALYRRILAVDPANFPAMNSLGYAEALAGRPEAAKQALEVYAKQPGQATNGLDSMGEAYFLNGRFKEAEGFFNQAYARDPKFLDGKTRLKAAYAHWLGGDLPGADEIFRDYASRRTGPALTLEQASWLWSTGRSEEAVVKLSSTPPALKSLVDRQIALWRAGPESRADVGRWKRAYDASMPPADAETRTFYATALAASGKLAEARELVKQWPLPTVTGDVFAGSQVYPEFLALRKKLGIE